MSSDFDTLQQKAMHLDYLAMAVLALNGRRPDLADELVDLIGELARELHDGLDAVNRPAS